MNSMELIREVVRKEWDAPASLADHAYATLLAEIITLELRPGQPLREEDLQQRVEAGRTPVREALHRLAADRLVSIHPRRGTFVSDLNILTMGDVFEMRERLEPLAARLAAERVSREALEQLAGERARLSKAVAHMDASQLLALDRRLHLWVYHETRNPMLEETLQRCLNLAVRLFMASFERAALSPERLSTDVLEFSPLLDAIADRQPAQAEEAARRHVVQAEAMLRGSW